MSQKLNLIIVWMLTGVLIVLVVVFGFIFYQQKENLNRQRQELKQLNKQLQTLQQGLLQTRDGH